MLTSRPEVTGNRSPSSSGRNCRIYSSLFRFDFVPRHKSTVPVGNCGENKHTGVLAVFEYVSSYLGKDDQDVQREDVGALEMVWQLLNAVVSEACDHVAPLRTRVQIPQDVRHRACPVQTNTTARNGILRDTSAYLKDLKTFSCAHRVFLNTTVCNSKVLPNGKHWITKRLRMKSHNRARQQ